MDPFHIDSDFEDDPPTTRGDVNTAPAEKAAAAEPEAVPEEERQAPEEQKQEEASAADDTADDGAAAGAAGGVVDFERERQARILRNRQALEALGVTQAAQELLADRPDGPTVVKKPKRKDREPKPKPVAAESAPVKRSRRLAGAAAENDENAGAAPREPSPEPLAEKLLTCEEYCDLKGIPKGHPVDGKFRGWVEEGVCKRIGVAPTAEEHWEKWGGNVQLKPPKGQQAKDHARSQLKSNPNQYFYRHNEPGEDEWHGEWSEEEIQRFVEVAKEHGCGNKWGLFATYIPHRVGYQCSAAHRHIMLPRGLLMDKKFMMTADGGTSERRRRELGGLDGERKRQ